MMDEKEAHLNGKNKKAAVLLPAAFTKNKVL